MKERRIVTLALAVLCAVFMFAGCKKQSGTETTGTVATDGSTSMEKVIGSLKEIFEANNNGIMVTYNPTGSGSGITAVAEGRCDIGLSSRDLRDLPERFLPMTALPLSSILKILSLILRSRILRKSIPARSQTGRMSEERMGRLY